jgi:uncharacterized protein with von Willebrand factor type A (vWA) domain
MTYALIKDGKVVNTIEADDSFINQISSQYDACVNITSLDPMPGKDWDYDGTSFADNRSVPPDLMLEGE